MRLLHTRKLRLEDFIGSQIPKYAILSHTWAHQQEISLQEIQSIIAAEEEDVVPIPAAKVAALQQRSGWKKILGARTLAASNGYDWIWIDTCCIDKTSSAELQEAINSMYKWYECSEICYVYLVDVKDHDSWQDQFEESNWWTRGWTLQELIAPKLLDFYTQDWVLIGTKWGLSDRVSSITGIRSDPLLYRISMGKTRTCVAEKLSWAAHRQTTREEDAAYCLLGIFDVNMPLLYGEGSYKAFLRLQEEIMKSTYDHSLFLWDPWSGLYENTVIGLLAPSAIRFCLGSATCDCAKRRQSNSILDYSTIRAKTPTAHASRFHKTGPEPVTYPGLLTSRGVQITLGMLNTQAITKYKEEERQVGRNPQDSFTDVALLNLSDSAKTRVTMYGIRLRRTSEDPTLWRRATTPCLALSGEGWKVSEATIFVFQPGTYSTKQDSGNNLSWEPRGTVFLSVEHNSTYYKPTSVMELGVVGFGGALAYLSDTDLESFMHLSTFRVARSERRIVFRKHAHREVKIVMRLQPKIIDLPVIVLQLWLHMSDTNGCGLGAAVETAAFNPARYSFEQFRSTTAKTDRIMLDVDSQRQISIMVHTLPISKTPDGTTCRRRRLSITLNEGTEILKDEERGV